MNLDKRPLILSLSKSSLKLHMPERFEFAKNCMLSTQLELVSVHLKMHQCLEENWNIIAEHKRKNPENGLRHSYSSLLRVSLKSFKQKRLRIILYTYPDLPLQRRAGGCP